MFYHTDSGKWGRTNRPVYLEKSKSMYDPKTESYLDKVLSGKAGK